MKRQLTKEEKDFSYKSIKRLEEDIEINRDYLEHYHLMYNKILKRNYEQTLKKYDKLIKDLEIEIKTNMNILRELKDQVKYGVEIKVKEDEKDEENEKKE